MSARYFIGIDDGTQSVRVVIYDEKGRKINSVTEKHKPLLIPRLGWAEHEKDDLPDSLCRASKRVMAEFAGDVSEIGGIGISSQRGTAVAVDSDGKMLHNPISWLDTRFQDNFRQILPKGLKPYDILLRYFSKFNWHRRNQPDIYKKAWKYMSLGAYFGHMLTGNYVDSVSNNLGWPYDPETFGIGSDFMQKETGITEEMMPEIVGSCGFVGKILPEAAEITGFPEGCPVYTCAGDKQCELIGANALRLGQSYLTLGTLCGLDVVTDKFTLPLDSSYLTYFSAIKGLFNSEVSVMKGFWMVSWFRDNICRDLKEKAEKLGTAAEELMGAEAEKIPAGCEGLVVLPDWYAPRVRPGSKGVFLGFDERHTRAHMYRSILEAIAMDIKRSYDGMSKRTGCSISGIIIGGGGSKSPLVAQIISDVFNVPVTRTVEPETCSLGAAMCAAVGSGYYSDLYEAGDAMVKVKDSFEPNAENHKVYSRLCGRVLKRIYPSLKKTFDELKNFN